MPKAQRLRHLSSAKRRQSKEVVGGTALATSVDSSLPSVNVAESERARTVQLSKKEKILERRESFLRKFGSPHPSFSKSHARRIKRKAKEQLAGQPLSDLSSALASLERDASGEDINVGAEPPTKDAQIASSRRLHSKPGIIGEGKPHPLSNHQRKCALELERLRYPLILQNPEFSANPFQTIRIHAQNTLLKHAPP